jgi:hypothetical protein
MTTLREQLDLAGFDWFTGRIIVQQVDGHNHPPGWALKAELKPGRDLDPDDSLLDREFSNGFGTPTCPRFIAADDKAMYVPSQYDGATVVERIERDLGVYLEHDGEHPLHLCPYPGG